MEVRKIHLNIPFELHRKMRVKCALSDISMQDYLSLLIYEDLKDFNIDSLKNQGKTKPNKGVK